jgi:hypothetical protein
VFSAKVGTGFASENTAKQKLKDGSVNLSSPEGL